MLMTHPTFSCCCEDYALHWRCLYVRPPTDTAIWPSLICHFIEQMGLVDGPALRISPAHTKTSVAVAYTRKRYARWIISGFVKSHSLQGLLWLPCVSSRGDYYNSNWHQYYQRTQLRREYNLLIAIHKKRADSLRFTGYDSHIYCKLPVLSSRWTELLTKHQISATVAVGLSSVLIALRTWVTIYLENRVSQTAVSAAIWHKHKIVLIIAALLLSTNVAFLIRSAYYTITLGSAVTNTI